jgi:hypothetical protein
MSLIKTIFIFLISFILGFGFWYLVLWFLTNEQNLFHWGMWTKGFYLIFSITSTSGALEEFTKY